VEMIYFLDSTYLLLRQYILHLSEEVYTTFFLWGILLSFFAGVVYAHFSRVYTTFLSLGIILSFFTESIYYIFLIGYNIVLFSESIYTFFRGYVYT
jgi:hypothetical protein